MLIIGGGEKKEGDCRILRAFVAASGGESARIAVAAAAASDGDEVGRTYQRVFEDLGAVEVWQLDLGDRRRVDQPDNLEKLSRATGVFFTGGDQLRITATLGGTRWLAKLFEARGQGLVIGGTSAGASAMSATMIVGGEGNGSPKRDIITMAPGLGLLESAVIDQHFAQRGRIGRLLAALAHNPGLLGIDEDTAIDVDPRGEVCVLGSRTVTVLDGAGLSYVNTSEADLAQSLSLFHCTLHVLSDGDRFGLTARRPRARRAPGGGDRG